MINQELKNEIKGYLLEGIEDSILCLELDLTQDELNAIKEEIKIDEVNDKFKQDVIEISDGLRKEKASISSPSKAEEPIKYKSKKDKKKALKKAQKEQEEKQKSQEVKKEETVIVGNKEVKKDTQEAVIEKYQKEIELAGISSPQGIAKRNMLAHTYFTFGMIEEARTLLQEIIAETGNYTSFRQLVFLEKSVGNIDDAKLWAYEAIDKFPKNIDMRKHLLSFAIKENDQEEITRLNKELSELMAANQALVYKAPTGKKPDSDGR